MSSAREKNCPTDIPERISFLQDAFASEQRCLHENLLSCKRIKHAGDRGEVNEAYFIDSLRHYLPNRYTIEKAMEVDSTGEVSDSIDVVIFDRQYTPTLLDSEKHRYVPAESVYAVFECKPTIDKGYLDYAANKAASVRKLHRTTVPIVAVDKTHRAKHLHHIVAGILAIDVDWADGLGKAFSANHKELAKDRALDCGFAASGACFDVFSENGALTFGPPENAWAYFAFRLLSRLQTIGTAPAVDWLAYAKTISFKINQEVTHA